MNNFNNNAAVQHLDWLLLDFNCLPAVSNNTFHSILAIEMIMFLHYLQIFSL